MGQDLEQSTDTVTTHDPGQGWGVEVNFRRRSRATGFRQIPCFFSLLKKVLRGMPSKPRGDALVAAGLVQGIEQPLSLVGQELGVPLFAAFVRDRFRATRSATCLDPSR